MRLKTWKTQPNAKAMQCNGTEENETNSERIIFQPSIDDDADVGFEFGVFLIGKPVWPELVAGSGQKKLS